MKQNLEFKSKYQVVTANTYTKYETDGFNSYQNYLYKRALYGLKGLPQEEIKTMCTAKQKRVNKVYYRAQKLLNLYKHQKTKELYNSLILTLFPKQAKGNLARVIANVDILSDCDEKELDLNTLSFKDLGITKQEIADLFVSKGILPANFYQLNPQDDPKFLPSLKVKS